MLLQQQKHAVAARSKTPTTNSLPYSSVAGKFANNELVSSQALIQCNASVQSGQSKNSGRTIASQVPNSSLISSNTSTLKNASNKEELHQVILRYLLVETLGQHQKGNKHPITSLRPVLFPGLHLKMAAA